MKIEIWSDIVCPWCYIGKRRFENALAQFPSTDQLEIEYKSFQLTPGIKTDPSLSINEFLAQIKGIPLEQAEQMNDHVTQIAASVGLNYQFDKTIPVNTFKAHRFLHFAKEQGQQEKAKEQLMKAYFTEGENVDDISVLVDVGEKIGLPSGELKQILDGDAYTKEVQFDIQEAQQLGVRGVPFFVIDRKYGISGAQKTTVFLQALEKAFAEWQEKQSETSLNVTEGDSCDTDEACN